MFVLQKDPLPRKCLQLAYRSSQFTVPWLQLLVRPVAAPPAAALWSAVKTRRRRRVHPNPACCRPAPHAAGSGRTAAFCCSSTGQVSSIDEEERRCAIVCLLMKSKASFKQTSSARGANKQDVQRSADGAKAQTGNWRADETDASSRLALLWKAL